MVSPAEDTKHKIDKTLCMNVLPLAVKVYKYAYEKNHKKFEWCPQKTLTKKILLHDNTNDD